MSQPNEVSATWRKSGRSQGNSDGDCVEVATVDEQRSA